MNKRTIIFVFSVLTVLVLVPLASADDTTNGAKPNAAEVLDKMQGFYKSTFDYQARFEQIYTDMAAGESKTTGGRVFLKKPGKMRWDYLDKGKGDKVSVKKVMVSNGSAFTIYEPEFNQFFRQCLKDSQLPTALSFLMGKGEMGKEFTPKLVSSKLPDTLAVEMTPKRSSGKYKKLVFVISDKTFAVQEAQIFDPYGNKNTLRFLAPLVNKQLPDQGFDFTAPEGARNVGKSDLKCE